MLSASPLSQMGIRGLWVSSKEAIPVNPHALLIRGQEDAGSWTLPLVHPTKRKVIKRGNVSFASKESHIKRLQSIIPSDGTVVGGKPKEGKGLLPSP